MGWCLAHSIKELLRTPLCGRLHLGHATWFEDTMVRVDKTLAKLIVNIRISSQLHRVRADILLGEFLGCFHVIPPLLTGYWAVGKHNDIFFGAEIPLRK